MDTLSVTNAYLYNIMIYYYIIIIILLLLYYYYYYYCISLYFIVLSFHLSSDLCEFSASSLHQRFFSLHHHIIIHFSLLFHISLILHNPFEFQLTIRQNIINQFE